MGATKDSYPNAIQGGIDVLGYKKVFAGTNGSNSIGDYAWYKQDSIVDDGVTSTMGTKLPNELGLYDMSVNVAEWCWDGYNETYKNSKATAGLLEYYRGLALYKYRVSCDNWIRPSLTSYIYK
jgi:formylglycine-generating enzyme required for sulfatase activity